MKAFRPGRGFRWISSSVLIMVGALVVSACGASSPPPRATALLTIVPPSATATTNTGIIDGEHVVLTPVDLDAEAAQRIYVHLTEFNTTPSPADPMWGVMANAGARVIVLAHRSLEVNEVQCESDCPSEAEEFRTEMSHIPEVLATLLQHLTMTAPSDGWDAFLDEPTDEPTEENIAVENIAWENIIISGHRDGAGKAAYLAAAFPVARAVLMSGPSRVLGYPDPSFEGTPEPDDRFIAFGHRDDAVDCDEVLDQLGVPDEHATWSADFTAEETTASRMFSELEPIDGFNVRNDWQHTRYRDLWEYVCCE